MTRTEKYKKYREEIKHSFFDEKDRTSKEISAELVGSFISSDKRQTNSLSFDEVMSAYETYETDEVIKPKKRTNLTKRNEIIFAIVMSIIIAALLVGVIITGINAFGGK